MIINIKLLTKLEVKAVRLSWLFPVFRCYLYVWLISLGTLTIYGWLASLSLLGSRSELESHIVRPQFVWLSYCFYSQLCKPFSEVLFDPISQQSRPQGFLRRRLGTRLDNAAAQWVISEFQKLSLSKRG